MGSAAGILTHAHGDTVDLQKLGKVTHAVVLEQVWPHQHAEKRRAFQVPAFGAVRVGNPAEGLQGLATSRAAQADLLALAPRELEPALRAVINVARQPCAGRVLPLDLLADKALADRVGGIEQHLLKVIQALQQAVQLGGGFLLGSGRVVWRHDVPLKPGDRAAALGHLRHDVAVFLFHVLEQLELRDHVALLCAVENAGQLGWREPTGRVTAHFVVQAGQVRGLRFTQLLDAHRLAVWAEDA